MMFTAETWQCLMVGVNSAVWSVPRHHGFTGVWLLWADDLGRLVQL